MLIFIERNGKDVDSEMVEILKEAQEATPEIGDTFTTWTPKTPNAQTSSSRDSPKLTVSITWHRKALAAHSAGVGQTDTAIISSKPDTNTGSTYHEHLNKILQGLKKEGVLSIKILQNFFKTLCTMT